MRTVRLVRLSLAGVLLGLVGCGGQSTTHAGTETGGSSGQGGQASSDAGRGNAGSAGAAGRQNRLCPTEQATDLLSVSADCRIVERGSDTAATCGGAPCPITRALDLVCTGTPNDAHDVSIAVTVDGAVLVADVRRLTVGATGTSVQDVSSLGSQSIVAATDERGTGWLLGTVTRDVNGLPLDDIGAVRQTEGQWLGSTIAPVGDFAAVTSAAMADGVGYLTYLTQFDYRVPHLLVYDGSCWTDESLVGDPAELHLARGATAVVQVDADKRPWVAWQTVADRAKPLYLRDPSGNTQTLLALPLDLDRMSDVPCLRLVPGSPGNGPGPAAVAVRYDDGIHLLTETGTADPSAAGFAWTERVLPESSRGRTAGDCPTVDRQHETEPCSGLSSCTEQVDDTSHGFGLARTASGRTFASWVVYSTQGSYALQERVDRGEMLISYCLRSETGGSGTADLVLARLTDAEPVLSHFRFDTESAVPAGDYPVAMAARGETLLVAAMLSGDAQHVLTYLEIDSSQLP